MYIRVPFWLKETSVVDTRGGRSESESSPTRKRREILQPSSFSERERERERERGRGREGEGEGEEEGEGE